LGLKLFIIILVCVCVCVCVFMFAACLFFSVFCAVATAAIKNVYKAFPTLI